MVRRIQRSKPSFRKSRSIASFVLHCLSGIFACTLIFLITPIMISPVAIGQDIGTPTDTPTTDSVPVISEFELLDFAPLDSFLSPVENYINSAPVRLNGRTLFRVASTDDIPAELRAEEIEQRLNTFVSEGIDPDRLEVDWDLSSDGRQPVIYINDNALLTITRPDATLSGLSDLSARAEEIEQIVQTALLNFYQERQPDFLWQQAKIAGSLLLLLGLISWLLTIRQTYLRDRIERAKRIQSAQRAVKPDPSSVNLSEYLPENLSEEVVTALRQRVSHAQKIGILEFQRWLCRLGQFLVWGVGIFFILGLFPQTRIIQPFILAVLKIPLRVVGVLLLVYGLIRVSNVLVDRISLQLQERTTLASARSQRFALRFSTFSQVIKSIVASVLIAIGIVSILSILGIELAPLLAGAGIVGLALSLASQNLLKDIINGFLILMEDQYGVGDVIVVGDVAGFVETMNLRITQLRNEEGRLITIPNSQIAIVQNLSKEWSRVDLMIPIAPSVDIDKALKLIEQVAQDMRNDPRWQQLILEPPMLLGVDNLDHVGATVRIWIKTLPLKQWDVAREYRRRLKIAFDQSGIDIGVPQQVLQVHNTLPVSVFSRHHSQGKSQPSHSEPSEDNHPSTPL